MPLVAERVAQRVVVGSSAEVREVQLEGQQRHRDREDAVGEREQAAEGVVALGHLVALAVVTAGTLPVAADR